MEKKAKFNSKKNEKSEIIEDFEQGLDDLKKGNYTIS